MINKFSYFVFTTIFLGVLSGNAISAINQGESIENVQEKINILATCLIEHRIKKVEIIWIDPNAESRHAIDPEHLERVFSRKLVIKNIWSDPLVESLIKAVKSTSVVKLEGNSLGEGDVRWGVKFFDEKNDKLVLSIYFDGLGETGWVSNKEVSFRGTLFKWLDQNFSIIFRKPRSTESPIEEQKNQQVENGVTH